MIEVLGFTVQALFALLGLWLLYKIVPWAIRYNTKAAKAKRAANVEKYEQEIRARRRINATARQILKIIARARNAALAPGGTIQTSEAFIRLESLAEMEALGTYFQENHPDELERINSFIKTAAKWAAFTTRLPWVTDVGAARRQLEVLHPEMVKAASSFPEVDSGRWDDSVYWCSVMYAICAAGLSIQWGVSEGTNFGAPSGSWADLPENGTPITHISAFTTGDIYERRRTTGPAYLGAIFARDFNRVDALLINLEHSGPTRPLLRAIK